MSLQTGEQVPEGPASTRFVDRARFRVDRVLKDPNPIWMRELRQSARLSRTPYILMSITIVATLIIAGVGGGVSQAARSDQIGQALYHTFFSLAFFVVALAGPALAANAIASEREGRTWEAVIFTGMSPTTIARGKFLAAFTAIASYVVMLGPVGALCFLFGGVDFLEVMIGFVYLFILSLLSVAFGLALSSKMASARGALLVTLLLAIPTSGAVFGMFGPGLAFAVHQLWERIPQGVPVWLPLAYVRGEFGLTYLVILFVVPVIAIGLPAWFLYEATVANLTEPTDDRSSGLKRWFVVSTATLAIAGALGMLPVRTPSSAISVTVIEVIALTLYLLFCVTVFMGEPLEASRRIRYRWNKIGATRLARWLGPSLERSFKLVIAGGLLAFAVVATSSITRVSSLPVGVSSNRLEGVARFVGYFAGFFVFCAGLAAWLRARSQNLFGARLIFVVLLGGLTILPLIVAAIAGIAFRASEAALALAAPSPIFGALLIDNGAPAPVTATGIVMSMTWAALGLALYAAGVRKARGTIAQYEERLARADVVLQAEDAMAESHVPPG